MRQSISLIAKISWEVTFQIGLVHKLVYENTMLILLHSLQY